MWLYVGLGIRFILWVARFIADAPGSTVHLRAFAPYALPFLALAVISATIWRTWVFRLSAIPLAVVGLIGALNGPRFDVLVAPSGDQAAVRDADGKLMIVGKRFNAFAAEQWLTADGDGRDPSQARDPDAPCDRLGCVAALPEGESLSLVLDRMAFDEDCERAEIVVSALTAPGDCDAKFVLDEKALARVRRGRADAAGRRRLRPHGRPRDDAEPPLVARSRPDAGRPDRAPGPCDARGGAGGGGHRRGRAPIRTRCLVNNA